MIDARRTRADVVIPEIASAIIRDRNVESFVSLSSKPNLTDVNFFAVILPEAKPVDGDFNSRPKTTRLHADGWIGAGVENGGNVYLGFFRTGPGNGSIEGFTTDAKNFTVSLKQGNGAIQTIYFEGTSFEGKGITMHNSTSATCALAFLKASTDIEVYTDTATELSFSFDGIPKNVFLNGTILHNWHYDPGGKMVSLKIPEGRHDISVKRN